MNSRRLSLFAIPLLLLSACSFNIGGGSVARSYYVLQEQDGEPHAQATPHAETLSVKDVTSNRFLNSLRILYTDDPSQRHFYQFASWVDTPPRYGIAILLSKLEKSGLYRSVARDREGLTGELTLNIEFLDFYHNTKSHPGTAEVRIRVELIDNREHRVIGRQLFTKSVPLSDYEASSAVDALGNGLNQALDEILVWLDTVSPSGSQVEPAKNPEAKQIRMNESAPNP